MADNKRTYNDKQLANGGRKLRAFREWLRDNPRAYEFGEKDAINTLESGQHTSGRAIVECIRKHEFTDAHGNTTTINNDYGAIIARKFVRDHPQYAERVKLRPCVFDVLMQGGGTND